MTRFLIIFAISTFIGNMTVAKTIIVRSGEHEGFTRLVLRLPDQVSWTLNQSERVLNLQIDHPDTSFDFSQVFDRISRNRLTALIQDETSAGLIIRLGCSCLISSFTEPPGFLVIDIKDQKDRPKPYFPTVAIPTNSTNYRFPSNERSGLTVLKTAQDLDLSVIPEGRATNAEITESITFQNIVSKRPTNTVNASEQRLLAQINRAADQGILKERYSSGNGQPDTFRVAAQDSLNFSSGENFSEPPPPVSLSAVTVFDRDLDRTSRLTRSINVSTECIKSDLVALHEWAGNHMFSEEIGPRRANLFGEFDELSSDAALELARAYLHFGFGLEGLLVISLGQTIEKQNKIISAIALLLDNRGLPADNPFTDQHNCEGDVALWSILPAETLPTNVNRTAVHMAFSRLPAHLRKHLGSRISRKFSQAGDSQMAQSILRIMERDRVDSESGIEIAKASVALILGDTMSVEQELSKSVESGSEYSAHALVELVAFQYENRRYVAPDLPELVAAYALEYRNTTIGTALRRTVALSLALSDQFEEAFATLQDIEARDGRVERQATLALLFAVSAERADDVSFLEFALEFAAEAQNTRYPVEIRDQVAQRLLELGFSEQAALWVANSEERVPSLESQLLRAEISLARLLPHRAMMELANLDGPEAANLQASAMWQIGNYKQAGQMLVAAEDYEAAARGFWIAEDWEAVPRLAEDHYADVVADSIQLQNDKFDVSLMPPLAQVRAMMKDSLKTRDGIAELLHTVSTTTISQ